MSVRLWLHRTGRLLSLERRGGLRERWLTVVLALVAAGALIQALTWDVAAAVRATSASGFLLFWIGAAGAIWLGVIGAEQDCRHSPLTAKPTGTLEQGLIRWVSAVGYVLTALAAVDLLIAVALIPWVGLRMPLLLGALLIRTLPGVAGLGSLAFAAGRLTRRKWAGSVVAGLWLLAFWVANSDWSFLGFSYLQNAPALLGIGCAAVLAALTLRLSLTRKAIQAMALLSVAVLVVGSGFSMFVWSQLNDGADLAGTSTGSRMLAPGEPLGDPGQQVALRGVLTPDSFEGGRMLARLGDAQRRLGAQGVRSFGLCLTSDVGEGLVFAGAGTPGMAVRVSVRPANADQQDEAGFSRTTGIPIVLVGSPGQPPSVAVPGAPDGAEIDHLVKDAMGGGPAL
jgi:hypothetical protein